LTALLRETIRQQLKALWPQDRASLERFRRTMTTALRYTLAAKWPGPDDIEATTAEPTARTGSLSTISVRHPGLPDKIELLVSAPAGTKSRATLLVTSTAQEAESVLRELGRDGQTVFVLRLRPHERETASGGDEEQRRQYVSTYYRTTLMWQVQDVLTALAYLTGQAGFSEVRLAAIGEAGIPTLLARAFDPTGKVSLTIADLGGLDDDEGTWTGPRAQAGMLRFGGLRTAAILAAPGGLILHNTGAHVDTAPIRAAYRALGHESAVEISEPAWSVRRTLDRLGAI
jgi:hypothetical protein